MSSNNNQRFKTVQIGNQSLRLPLDGANPAWGENLTAIIEALVDASALIQGPNDILTSSANILNDQSVPVQFSNVVFDTGSVLSFTMNVFIVRQHNPGSGLITLTQSGIIEANYDGSNWKLTQSYTGDAGVVFTITAGGTVEYSSSNLVGHILGTARYNAKTIDEAI